MRIGIFLGFIAMVSAPLALAQEITGLWKHAQEPGWIEIEMQETPQEQPQWSRPHPHGLNLLYEHRSNKGRDV